MSAEIVTLVPGLAPAAPVMRVLAQFNRRQIEAFAEVAIALLDLQDGDADAEAEEDVGEEEDGEQGGWSNRIDQRCLLAGCMWGDHDDCEDDDPSGQCDEDGVNTAAPHTTSGPGCEIADPGEGEVAL